MKLEDLHIGLWITTPLGGRAKITTIDGERIYFENGGFSGSCHYTDLKG
jgi:hypothetical protein